MSTPHSFIHLQPYIRKPIKPKLPRTKPNPLALSRPAAISPCTECGKRFHSWKALFGHMRCHPERHWRGINPPPRNDDFALEEEEHEVASCLLLLSNGPVLCRNTKKVNFIHDYPCASVHQSNEQFIDLELKLGR